MRIFDKPANAKIPNTESIHSTKKTEAIARKGLGRIPIIIATTRRIRIFHKVIGCPLIKNKVRLGITRPLIWI